MKINSDFRELLQKLNAARVRYLVVGGYAVMAHTEPRYTKDLDVWVEPVESNAETLFTALAAFGAPTKAVTPKDFTEPNVFFQIGVEPVRIDIMTSVAGLEFSDSWSRRLTVDFGGEPAPVLCREDVIRAKRAAGRIHDHKDIARLESKKAPRRLSKRKAAGRGLPRPE